MNQDSNTRIRLVSSGDNSRVIRAAHDLQAKNFSTKCEHGFLEKCVSHHRN